MGFLDKLFGTFTFGRNIEEREGIVYKKNSLVPFTGLVETEQNSNFEKPPRTRINYKEGLRDGLTTKFYYIRQNDSSSRLGIKPLEDRIQETCEYRKGLKNGVRKLYDKLGQLEREENYQENKLHGPTFIYDEGVRRTTYGNYDKGELVPYVSYYENGNIHSKKYWKLGSDSETLIKVGVWEYYHETYETLLHQITYNKEGKKEQEKEYCDGYNFSTPGQLKVIKSYKNGFHTLTEEFWTNHELKIRIRFYKRSTSSYPRHFKREFFWYDGRTILIQENNKTYEEDGYSYTITEFDPWTNKKETFKTNNFTNAFSFFSTRGNGYHRLDEWKRSSEKKRKNR